MKSIQFTLLLVCLSFAGYTQVGIGTTDPKASLDISSSNITNPSSNDGLLIPKIDNFPSTNPGPDQDGMMVFVTGNGAPTKGFYYWDNGTSTWVSVVGVDTKNTLDGAYDEGGNGSGKNIVADNGSVRINGTDGFLVTGTFGSGNTMDSEITGSGTRMFFNPRKAAFRAGAVTSNQWNDINIGDYSVAMGRSTTASNTYDVAIGFGSLSTGSYSTTLGWANRASGAYSVSIGQNSTASGWSSTALGRVSSATGSESMVFGHDSSISGTRAIGIGNYLESPSGYEISMGYYNTLYTPVSTLGINISDRLFSIGNGISSAARSNALTIFKDGTFNINDSYNMPLTDGTAGQVMTTDGAGQVSFTTIGGGDDDWYVQGTSSSPTSINDNVYTMGKASVGNSSVTDARLYVASDVTSDTYGYYMSQTGSKPGLTSYGFYNLNSLSDVNLNNVMINVISGTNNGINYGIRNAFLNNGIGTKYGLSNEFDTSAPGGPKIGVQNRFQGGDSFVVGLLNDFPATWSINGTINGILNNINAGGNTIHYGTQNLLNGLGSGAKYGSYNLIGSTAGGTHYGVYSDVQKASGYAGYFLGRTSLGNATTNRYLMPAADGTAGQVMTTDGAGNLNFVDASSIISSSDNQNLSPATLTGTTLNLGIQNGTGTTVDLSSLQDGTGTDNQNLSTATLTGTTLNLGIQNGTGTSVNLASLQDGTGTDNQNLSTATLTGTTLNLGIQNGTGTTIDLSSLQDGTGTDNQNLSTATLTGTTLNLGIQNGTGTSVDLTSLQDGNTQNTLDQAYDEGGIGNGRTINATDGALRINGDDGFLVTGTAGSGNTIDSEITGAGTRMFFNPRKGAFRSGRIDANQWNDANIGFYSFAVGENTTASSSWDIAMGLGTTASGGGSIALGNDTVASGLLATAIGDQNIASGDRSLALGSVTIASGNGSSAMGSFTIASGSNSFALGTSTTSASFSETSIGIFNTNYTPNNTTAFNASDRLFVVGNGINAGNRSNALTIFKSGLMNINDAYNMPLTDGSAGQVMTTDGAGNVTFQDSFNEDSDWFEVGSTNPPNSLNDDKYTGGSLSIGKNTTAIGMVDIENNNKITTLSLVNTYDPPSSSSPKYGIQNSINSTEQNTAIQNELLGNSSSKTGVSNFFSGNMTAGLVTGFSNTFETTGNNNQIAIYNTFASTLSTGTTITGLRNWFQNGSNYTGPISGIKNDFNNDNNGEHTAILNTFTGTGTGVKYGVKTIYSGNGNGIFYGNYTELSNTGSGNKYGNFISILNTSGGIHYGIYSDVQNLTGYAGYFIGRTSLGNTTTNRYIMPASDGTNGQVMLTDGSGNLTWQNPNTGTDNQQIDTFSFNSTTNELTLELEDDGQPAQIVNLSSLNPQKAIARLFMSASQTETGSGLSKVNFDSAEFDIGNNFNTTTDEFVVPQTGIYSVTTQITMDASTSIGTFDVRIRVNGAQQRRTEYNHIGNGQIVRQITSILSLTAGDTLDVAFSRPAIGATIQANSRASFFEVEQL